MYEDYIFEGIDEIDTSEVETDEDIAHEGVKRRSGRYPWGSGEDPYQHEDFWHGVESLRSSGMSYKEIAEDYGMNAAERRAMYYMAVKKFRETGMSDTEIARNELDISTTELRAIIRMEKAVEFDSQRYRAMTLKNKGMSGLAISEKMGISEGQVRNLLNEQYQLKHDKATDAADALAKFIDAGNYADVGKDSELYMDMGINNSTMKQATAILKERGYAVEEIKVIQSGTGKRTTIKVVAPPGTTAKEISHNRDKIQIYSPSEKIVREDGEQYTGLNANFKYPASVSRDRIHVRYGDDEQSGAFKDGVIQIKRGVKDISLGNATYAQVRIMVDDKMFMKGMAVYAPDSEFPPGCDIIYNSNKPKGTLDLDPDKSKESVFKKKKDNPDNPFGATIDNQLEYEDDKGNKTLSAINIVNQEGTWDGWHKSLSSQFLSKQNMDLIQKQLNLAYVDKKAEYDDILAVDNPVVREELLLKFADGCDSAAVDLRGASLPRQSTKVILPVDSLPDGECFAPGYKPGETLCLIRYPHSGTFEIAQVKVTDKNPEAEFSIGQAMDAIGINHNTAMRLSGADFDGDNVIAIPCNSSSSNVKIEVSNLKALEGFADEMSVMYQYVPGMKVMTSKLKQLEMGKVSNLITDMTLKGAPSDEIARAVKHSMVVIDAEKHKLNYEKSFEDNNIAELKKLYQGGERKGASTLISKASGERHINEVKEGKYITDPETGKTKLLYFNPETGEKYYRETGREITKYSTKIQVVDPKTGKLKNKEVSVRRQSFTDNDTGETKVSYHYTKDGKLYTVDEADVKVKKELAKTKTTKMESVSDAFELLSKDPNVPPHAKEIVYANFANSMKELGNLARKSSLESKEYEYSKEAAEKYSTQVSEIKQNILIARKNSPRERQAQLITGNKIYQMRLANPDISKEDLKKYRTQALNAARKLVGAEKQLVVLTPLQIEAIKAGAINKTTMKSIVANADLDNLKSSFMNERHKTVLTDAKQAQIKAKLNSGFTIAEIAEDMGLSASTINGFLKGERTNEKKSNK